MAAKTDSQQTRREFLKTTAVAAAAATFATGCAQRRDSGPQLAPAVHTGQKTERIRVGVIGCGGRGTGAAIDAHRAWPGVEIVALGDLFPDHLETSKKSLQEHAAAAYKVSDDRCFTGFDAYRGVLACDIDYVILATPPGFRPLHLKAAIDAKKHVFMEKPVAVDPPGVRSVIASSAEAAANKLGIAAGTQRRHQPHYVEALRRVRDGQIGDIVAAQCYWCQGGLWVKKQEPGWSDMEWQCRNWLYFPWLSGDHIVEQHVHNLDVVNWAIGSPPVKCLGSGGRQWRTAPEYGNIYDHFSVEYEYAGGVRVLSMCRQIDKTSDRVAERIVGTRGVLRSDWSIAEITGRRPWKFEDGGKPVNPYEQEHLDLITSIVKGKPINEGKQVAESTLTAIMGRMSAYTGREVSWDWVMNASKLDLTPPAFAFGPLPVGEVPMPGVTQLV